MLSNDQIESFRYFVSEVTMFLVLFIILLIAWLLGWVAFHAAGGLIHLLLILAIIAIVVHLFRGRRAI